MKCEYCDVNKYEDNWDGRKIFHLGWDCYTSLDMYYNPANNKFSMSGSGEGEVEIEINYCPKCGRKLI